MTNDMMESKYASDLTITNIRSVCTEKLFKPWKHVLLSNPYHRVLFVFEGEFIANINDQTFVVKKNDILYVPKNAKYSSNNITKNFHYTSIFFEMDDKRLNEYDFDYLYRVDVFEKFKKIFATVDEEWLVKKVGYKLKIRMMVYDIFRNLLIEKLMLKNALYSQSIISNAVNYIDANYYKGTIDVNKLSKMSNITTTHFIRLFKEIYGTTPKKYINKLKIDRAIELLEFTASPIGEIAQRVGYSDVSYFSRCFKSITGKSPLQFKNHC